MISKNKKSQLRLTVPQKPSNYSQKVPQKDAKWFPANSKDFPNVSKVP
jgi:hypothetical protein